MTFPAPCLDDSAILIETALDEMEVIVEPGVGPRGAKGEKGEKGETGDLEGIVIDGGFF